MHRYLPVCLFLVAPLLAETPAEVEKQVHALSKEIEEARGLKFKKPVIVKVVARGKDAMPGVNAYYDVRKKEVILFDDIKGNYSKGVLIHELVHALQDQHFDLKTLHGVSFGSDGELARAALIEGDAMLVTIEMLQKEQPGIAMMLKSPLDKSKNLQNGFLYGQGARWVKHVKDKGKGWAAVNRRYAFPPMSTATILHPTEFVMPVKLGPGKTLGEFGIIKMLMSSDKTAPKALEAASGWRGDRLITEGDASGWAVAFADEKQAERFLDVLKTHPAKAKSSMSRVGKRVYEVSGGEKERAGLTERLQGKPLLTVYSARDKKEVGFGQMIDALGKADIVCVGEQHDSEADHFVQLMVIKGLFALDERMGVGMEMFQRPFQKALDRYTAGDLSEAAMLEDTEYKTRWGYDWGLYRPIADFCRRNRVPLAGLNIGNELRKRLSDNGHDKLTDDERKQIGEADFQVKTHRDYHFPRLGQMHGHGTMPKDQQERMYQVMTVWDEYMADSAVKFLAARDLRRVVVLAGGGHVERHFGIPDRAAKRLKGGTIRTVRIVSGGSVEGVAKEPQADFVVLTR